MLETFSNYLDFFSEDLTISEKITIEVIKKIKRMEVMFIYRKILITKNIAPITTATMAPSTNKSLKCITQHIYFIFFTH